MQDELDVFAAEMTGMPDFALQSMGELAAILPLLPLVCRCHAAMDVFVWQVPR